MSDDRASNPKLSQRLKRALLFTLLAVLVLATIAAAVSAYIEASDIQDETLLSVAGLVETNQINAHNNPSVIDSGIDTDDDDHLDQSAIRVWEMGGDSPHGFTLKKPLKNGFHSVLEGDDFWRVYVTRKNRTGKQYVVAQKLAVSAELALRSAVNTAVPLLLLFLLIPLLVTIVVRHSFRPLNILTEKVGESDSLNLDLAKQNEIPVEVLPFVSAIDSLLEKNQAFNLRQRRFIADAAHELRTPITALSLEIENLQSAKNEDVKNKRQAALASSIIRLQRLVNQLLDLARAQSIEESTRVTVDLNDLVKSQIADVFVLAENKQIEISVGRNDPVEVVDINSELQHLLRNALSNAIKFTPDLGSVTIDVYRENDHAVFCVVDSGPGVNPEYLSKLHQPFYRPDGQASGSGAGLGLAICHEIAMHLQGQLQFDNVSPHGFRFCYKQLLA